MTQQKQKQWLDQWQIFQDDELFLFKEWIHPNLIEDFTDKRVLECGCGGGQHTSFVARVASSVLAVDLNSLEVARARNANARNVDYLEADISEMSLKETFDIVFSIGVVHHTDDPEKTVENIIAHLKPGGRLILWVYSKEGNWITENVAERARRVFLKKLSVPSKLRLSQILTALMYVPIYTIYMLPLRSLPYYEYFTNFRKLSFRRNTLNVFDKLNAPQVVFIERQRVLRWFQFAQFTNLHLAPYKGVSWQASGTLIDV